MTNNELHETTIAVMRSVGLTPDPWQLDVITGDYQRLLLNCSRQSGKSTVTAIAALHTAIHSPGSLVAILSPSQRQSQEMFRTITRMYSKLDPLMVPGITFESMLRTEFKHGSRIIAMPSTERTVRGLSGVNMLILDEAARVPDELLQAVRPMLATSADGGVICCTD